MLNLSGDLNILNDNRHTPIAFGSAKLLASLNLMNNVAVVKTSTNKSNIDSNNNQSYQQKFAKYIEPPG